MIRWWFRIMIVIDIFLDSNEARCNTNLANDCCENGRVIRLTCSNYFILMGKKWENRSSLITFAIGSTDVVPWSRWPVRHWKRGLPEYWQPRCSNFEDNVEIWRRNRNGNEWMGKCCKYHGYKNVVILWQGNDHARDNKHPRSRGDPNRRRKRRCFLARTTLFLDKSILHLVVDSETFIRAN